MLPVSSTQDPRSQGARCAGESHLQFLLDMLFLSSRSAPFFSASSPFDLIFLGFFFLFVSMCGFPGHSSLAEDQALGTSAMRYGV